MLIPWIEIANIINYKLIMDHRVIFIIKIRNEHSEWIPEISNLINNEIERKNKISIVWGGLRLEKINLLQKKYKK